MLEKQLITVKLAKKVPAARNRPDVIERRHAYAKWYLQQSAKFQLIWIDETGVNLYCSRSFARSSRGDDAFVTQHLPRGQNVTLMLAVAENLGVLNYEVHHSKASGGDGTGAEVVARFVSATTAILANLDCYSEHKPIKVIMDNASSHTARPVFDMESSVFLPAYSPFLNPCEEYFSMLKAAIKTVISKESEPGGSLYTAPGGSLRRDVLESIIKECCYDLAHHDSQSPDDSPIHGFVRHMVAFLPDCIERIPMSKPIIKPREWPDDGQGILQWDSLLDAHQLKSGIKSEPGEPEDEGDDILYDLCPICDNPADGDTVGCDVCGDWIHFECDPSADIKAVKYIFISYMYYTLDILVLFALAWVHKPERPGR